MIRPSTSGFLRAQSSLAQPDDISSFDELGMALRNLEPQQVLVGSDGGDAFAGQDDTAVGHRHSQHATRCGSQNLALLDLRFDNGTLGLCSFQVVGRDVVRRLGLIDARLGRNALGFEGLRALEFRFGGFHPRLDGH